jgi:phosphoglycerol transferase MdoB-like AlkP superfamily enzyme
MQTRILDRSERMGAGLTRTCAVEILNSGTCILPAGEPIHLSYHWKTLEGAMAVFDGLRTPLPLPLSPGTRAVVMLKIRAPDAAGVYRLCVDPVWEHRFWFSRLPGWAGEEAPVVVDAPALEIRGKAPSIMMCLSSRAVTVKVTNNGPHVLRAEDDMRLAYHFEGSKDRKSGAAHGVAPFPLVLKPGGSAEYTLQLEAPARQGMHTLVWEVLTSEGVPVRSVRASALPTLAWKHSSVCAMLLSFLFLAAGVLLCRGTGRWVLLLFPALWFILSLGWKTLLFAELTLHVPNARFVLLSAGSGLLFVLPFLPLRWRPQTAWLLAMNALLSFILFADLAYFRYFDDIASFSTFRHVGQLGAVKGSILPMLEPRAWRLLLDLPLALAFSVWGGLQAFPGREKAPRRLKWGVAALAFMLCLPLALVEVHRAKGEAHGVFSKRFKNLFLASELGIINYHVFDMGEEVWKGVFKSSPSPDDLRKAREHFDPSRRTPWLPSVFSGIGRNKNILLIQEESWEGFAPDAMVGGMPVMPFINEIKKDLLVFPNFFDETAHGRTSDAEFLALTGLHPPPGGSAFFQYAGNRFLTLAHLLKKSGYATLFAHPYEKGFWNRYAAYAGFGFDRLLFDDAFAPGRAIGWGLSNEDLFAQTVPKLEELPRPFFAFLVTLTDHHPYADLPVPESELPLGDLQGTLLGRYLKVCWTKDRALRLLAERLKGVGLLEDTVILLYGDHDAGLDWNSKEMALAGLRPDSPLDFYEGRRLPLLVHAPGASATIPKAGGQGDLPPTVLDLAGIDPSLYPFLGQSLLSPGEGWVALTSASFRTDHLRLVRRGLSGRPECYDLASRREVDIALCRPYYEKTMERLQVSQTILEADLITELLPAVQPHLP